MLTALQKLDYSMRLKVHFLNSHMNYFPENVIVVSEDDDARFNQVIKKMEKRYREK